MPKKEYNDRKTDSVGPETIKYPGEGEVPAVALQMTESMLENQLENLKKARREREKTRLDELRQDEEMVRQVREYLTGATIDEPDLVVFAASDVVLLMLDILDELENDKAKAKLALSEVSEYADFKDLSKTLSEARKNAKIFRRENIPSTATFGDMD